MSLAVRFYEASDPEETIWFLSFDVVTNYSRSAKGSVAKHPVDKDGEINDHFSLKNGEYSVTGIVSFADISMDASLLKDSFGNSPTNTNSQPHPISVEGGNSGLLNKLVPDSIGQFIPSKPPKVLINPLPTTDSGGEIDDLRVDWANFVRNKLKDSMKYAKVSGGVSDSPRTDYFPLIADIYRFDRNGVITEDIVRDLILTSVEERESAESNGALFLTLTLEEVRFVSIEDEKLDVKKVAPSMTDATAQTKNLGGVSPEESSEVIEESSGRSLLTKFADSVTSSKSRIKKAADYLLKAGD